ncbi:PfkB family carbohydrate kinase [Kineothrix sp. MB12-C1]|uniref:PfkB family carbohydrate kinase n=1 Tax=Kineothrix sp. MB12-C1 TaxID=3070215 RepID=UPI0027D2EE84|nr:PfkB family carbohydrate kinase [Kineothrix sp. MB12-C1]WMC93771.1 PfkB family carbohydrate kinase [Kineothrix sp. MB12-C1]
MNIKDIAKLCGVSPSTVSKILHNKDEDISALTRKKVLEVIKEYQYVPYSKVINSMAPKTNIIGVLLSDSTYGVQDILYRIEAAAIENGYSIMLCNTAGDKDKEEKYYQIMKNKGVDGIISVCQAGELPEDMKIPAVQILDKKSRTGKNKAADIYFDMRDVGYLAANYLLEKGHNKIACLLEAGDEEIMAGYLKAYKERFVSPNKEWIFLGTEEDIISIGISKCLNEDITAVICANAEIGNVVYEKIRERGDIVPDKISVISVRDSSFAEKSYPKMTAVHVSALKVGNAAVNALIQIMEGRKPVYECREKIEPDICERNSVMVPTGHEQGGKIVVVGSMNMDCMINVSHIPTGGETVRSRNIISLPGGKGANQAVGAGKLGGLVYMIGRLGNDSDGKEIYNSLVNSGVKTDGVVFDDAIPTGKAYINVAADGESTIVIYPGANEKLDRSQVRQYEQLLDDAKYCLLTLEISEETVEYTIQKCKKKKVKVILKPSSVEKMKESLFENIDYFVPNEKEVKQLIPEAATIEEKADILVKKGVKNVIITLGHKGCYLKNDHYEGYFPAADFHPVDTTGAADAFISALAVSLSEGNGILRAIGFATYAAGISVARQGVQPAMVDRRGLSLYKEEIDSFCGKNTLKNTK